MMVGTPILWGTHTHTCTHSISFSTVKVKLFLDNPFCVATFPDELGMSVPLTEEEQKELLYVPLDGEWGCRTRAEECERIIKAIDQLCTLGMMSSSPCENNSSLMSCKQGCEVKPRGHISRKEAAA